MLSEAAGIQEEYTSTDEELHEYLLVHTESLLRRLRAQIHNGLVPAPVVLFWPKQAIRADDGTRIQRLVAMNLPDEDVTVIVQGGAERVGAYAYLTVIPTHEAVSATLTTPLGETTWRMERCRHGDIFMLDEPVRQTQG
jgi:hypothetical protein